MNDENGKCAFHDRIEADQDRQWVEIGRRLHGTIFFWGFGIAVGILIAIQGMIYQQTLDIKISMAAMGVTISATDKRLESHLREWNRYRGRIDREIKKSGNDREGE